MRPLLRIASAFLLSASLTVHAQAQLKSVNLVAPAGKGRVIVPLSEQRKWLLVSFMPANDFSAGGPSITLQDIPAKLEIVYTLTGNSTHSAKDCLDKAMNAIEHTLATGSTRADIKQGQKSDSTNASGQPLLSDSFLVTTKNGATVSEQHVYGVTASRDACAEIQIAKTDYTPADDPAMQAALQTINLDADYTPAATDYLLMAVLIGQLSHGRGFAGTAAYYQRALDTLPADAATPVRRNIIDQLSTSYDRIGQADKGRTINEAAIKADADYPMYYYNLARIDAENERANEAKAHLQQAWDRKANLASGQQMPSPVQDPSFQKLKGKSDFWSYLQSLK